MFFRKKSKKGTDIVKYDVIINNYILDDFNNFEAVYVLVL